MTLFTIICNAVGFVSNICILFLTIYTLHLTAFSKKMDFISMGHSSSIFFGDTFFFYIRNRSLHSIPITKVFLLKRIGGMFYMIGVADYKQPLIIDAWHIEKIETEPFTHICGIDESDEPDGNMENKSEKDCCGEDDADDECEKPSLSMIHMDAVIGVEAGNEMIWIKPYKKAPLREAKRAYRKHNFGRLTVSRNQYGDKVLSKSVDYVINLLVSDLNGQKVIKTVFAVAGDQNLLLSDTICGHNGLDGHFGSSAKELKECLCERFGIDKNNISVEKVKRMF